MNKALSALMIKINWQLKELALELENTRANIQKLDSHLDENRSHLAKALEIPAFIFPEQEISRLNFIIRQQQSQDELLQQKTAYQSQYNMLKERELRLNTELKMLVTYEEKQNQLQIKQAELIHQKNSDERFLLENHSKKQAL